MAEHIRINRNRGVSESGARTSSQFVPSESPGRKNEQASTFVGPSFSSVGIFPPSNSITAATSPIVARDPDPDEDAVSASGGPQVDIGNAEIETPGSEGPQVDIGNAEIETPGSEGPQVDIGNAEIETPGSEGPQVDIGNAEIE